jgi:hypothetical protein
LRSPARSLSNQVWRSAAGTAASTAVGLEVSVAGSAVAAEASALGATDDVFFLKKLNMREESCERE